MKVLIFGGTGFIGRHLIPLLIKEGYEVVLFTRNPGLINKSLIHQITAIGWDARSPQKILEQFSGNYSIINLAGESIGAKLWTKKQKHKILSSRIRITKAIVEAVRQSPVKPVAVLQGSAIGYYGSQSDTLLEESSPKGSGFLADVVEEWENSVKSLENIKSRIVYLRTGVVLASDGGILPLMLLPFKLFVGGHLGNGKQWLSWIHISDEVRAIIFLLKNVNATGIYNLTSPEPIKMKDFASLAGKALGRPSWLHFPVFILKTLPNGMADDLLLTSQRVFPLRLVDGGFQFNYRDAEAALQNLIVKNKGHE